MFFQSFRLILTLVVGLVCFHVVECETNITLTGSVENYVFSLTIINESMSWFRASNYCKEAGLGILMEFQPRQARVHYLTEFLRTNNHSSPVTFWTGHFRPFPQILKWYSRASCRRSFSLGSAVATYMDDRQCAAMYYKHTDGFGEPTFFASNCEQAYSFICYQYNYTKTVEYLYGSIVSTTAMQTELLSLNQSYCEYIFENKTNCALYYYNDTDETCVLWEFQSGYGQGEALITTEGENITLGFKEGVQSAQYSTLNDSFTFNSVDSVFPECNVSPIPDNYCPCGIPDGDFEHLLQSMTVDASSTAKAKQKLHSAEDKRTSSRVVGSVGIVIIAVVIVLIGLVDISTLIMNFMHWWGNFRSQPPGPTGATQLEQ